MALLAVAVAFCGMVALHALRSDVSPLRDVMSHYANGADGPLMSVVFYAFGLSVIALGLRLRTGLRQRGAGRAVPILLWLSGGCLLAAGVFEVDPPLDAPTVGDQIHSDAAVFAFVVLIGVMYLLALVGGHDGRWRSFRGTSLGLAAIATVFGIANRFGSGWEGAAQRVTGGAVLVWEMLVALRVRRQGFES